VVTVLCPTAPSWVAPLRSRRMYVVKHVVNYVVKCQVK
jgi:hypothetical protein